MIGGLGEPDSETHATDLVRRIAITTGANLRLLPAPGMVSTVEMARLLRSEPYIAQALEMMQKVDIAFAGIGAPTDRSLLMREEKIIKWQEIKRLSAMGAVGEIGLQFYDVNGNLIHSDLDERVIGISLESMRKLNRMVGVAGGSEKFEAILGAVRGSFINTLITDTHTARRLIEAAL
jgi:DNA-binding transcriptional regulator LsrR (DeoR family)